MTVDRTVCISGLSSTCDQMVDIKVRNCGSYRTYYLTQLNVDKSAYCFGMIIFCRKFCCVLLVRICV